MAEWSKATVLKTVVGFSYRGFESLFIRFDRSSIRANRRVESKSQLSVFIVLYKYRLREINSLFMLFQLSI